MNIHSNNYNQNATNETDLVMLPGPVRIHPRVERAMSQPIIGHRTDSFRKFYLETVNMFKKYLNTQNDLYLFAGSGTVALEAAVANFVDQSKETKVINFVNGKFSDRTGKIAIAYGANVIMVNIEWGDPVTPELVENTLKQHLDVEIVAVCHNETSTGVLQPIKEIGEIVHRYNALLMVDGITSVGGLYVCPEKQNIDILASGSQKSWGLPPGLALIVVSPKAWEKLPAKRHTFYVDLKAYQSKHITGDTPWTPAISLIYGLHESLLLMLEETEKKRTYRQEFCSELIRTGVKALGWKLLAKPGYYSPVVTAIRVPDEVNISKLRNEMKKMGVQIAGTQNQLKEKYIRIASMNMVRDRDVLTTFAVLEVVLAKLGYQFNIGISVKAIQETIRFSNQNEKIRNKN